MLLTNEERTLLASKLSKYADSYNRVSISKLNKAELSHTDKQNAVIDFQMLTADMKASNTWRIDLPTGVICFYNVQHWEIVEDVDPTNGNITKRTRAVMSREDFEVREELRLLAGRLSQYGKDNINNANTQATQAAYDALVDRTSKWTSAVELHFTTAKVPATTVETKPVVNDTVYDDVAQ